MELFAFLIQKWCSLLFAVQDAASSSSSFFQVIYIDKYLLRYSTGVNE